MHIVIKYPYLIFDKISKEEIEILMDFLSWEDKDGNKDYLLFDVDNKLATYWGLWKPVVESNLFNIEEVPISPFDIKDVKTPFVEPKCLIFDDPDAELYPHQVKGVEKALMHTEGILKMPTGSGKCFAPGTKILMYDGSIKRVEDIRVGDQVMGPDSEPRNVTELSEGEDDMYEITPIKGEPWVCNSNHILHVVTSGFINKQQPAGARLNIPIRSYMDKPEYFKKQLKLARTGVDFYRKKETTLPIECYFLGIWLGDGRNDSQVICNNEPEILTYLKDYANHLDMLLSTYVDKRRASMNSHSISRIPGKDDAGRNQLVDAMRSLNLFNNKHIPVSYLTSSRENRLKVLAGILDTDGYYDVKKRGGFEIVTKYPKLRDDILYLVRSLGLAAYSAIKKVKLKGWEVPREYHRIYISGDTSVIPTIVSRKQPIKPTPIKDPMRTGFTVRHIGRGKYNGFSVDKDNLFLLSDFTVVHNSETFLATIAHIVNEVDSVVFMFPGIGLARQAMTRAIKEGFSSSDVGLVGGGYKQINKKIKFCVIDSLFAGLKKQNDIANMIKECEVLVIDECHSLRAFSWKSVYLAAKNAKYRIAVSATPYQDPDNPMSSYGDATVLGLTGGVIYSISEQYLVQQGIIAKSLVHFKPMKKQGFTSVSIPYNVAYDKYIVNNDSRNAEIVRWVRKCVEKQVPVMVLVNRHKHAEILMDMLPDCRVIAKFDADRSLQNDHEGGIHQVFVTSTWQKDFAEGKWDVLIGTPATEVGTDIPSVGMLIIANAGKSYIKATQRRGRGTRKKKTGNNVVLVLEFFDNFHPFFRKQSGVRKELYERDGTTLIDSPAVFERLFERNFEK